MLYQFSQINPSSYKLYDNSILVANGDQHYGLASIARLTLAQHPDAEGVAQILRDGCSPSASADLIYRLPGDAHQAIMLVIFDDKKHVFLKMCRLSITVKILRAPHLAGDF